MLKKFIEFLSPGSLLSDKLSIEVQGGETIDMPNWAYAYRFFYRESVEHEGEVLWGKEKDCSPRTYLGEELTLQQVKELPGDNHILIYNLEANNEERVLRSKFGRFEWLDKGDTVVPSCQRIHVPE
jgi:hypothetical protein